MLVNRVLCSRQVGNVRALLIRKCLPDPAEDAGRPFDFDSEDAISIREAQHVWIATTNRNRMWLALIEDIGVRLPMRARDVNEWLVVALV